MEKKITTCASVSNENFLLYSTKKLYGTSRHIGDTNTVKFYMARRREESREVSPAFGLLFH